MSTPKSQTELSIFADRVLSGSGVPRSIGTSLGDNSSGAGVRRRWGRVTKVTETSGRVDVRIDGVVIPDIPYIAWYTPSVGEIVGIEYAGNDQICVGPVAPSPKNKFTTIDHTHPKTADTAVVEMNVTNATLIPNVTYIPNSAVNSDQIDLNLSANTQIIEPTSSNVPAVAHTIRGPGVLTPPPNGDWPQGARLKFRVRTRSKGMRFQLATGADYDFASFGTSMIDLYRDQVAYLDCVWDKEMRRWLMINIANNIGLTNNRPNLWYRDAKSELGPTTFFSSGYGIYAPLYLLIHTMQAPSSSPILGSMYPPTGTYTDWTYLAGVESYSASNTSNRVAMKVWAKKAPYNTNTINITANNEPNFTTSILYTVGASMPTSADVVTSWSTINPANGNGLGNVVSPGFNRMFIFAAAHNENANNVTYYGWYKGRENPAVNWEGLSGLGPIWQTLTYENIVRYPTFSGIRYHDVPGPSEFHGMKASNGSTAGNVQAGIHLKY